MTMLRVVVVDDHPMFRMGLSAAIAEMAGIEVVGEAGSAAEVDAVVATTRPDIVLLDVQLGDGSGIDVNRRLAVDHPAVKVVMLTMSDDHDTVLVALGDGARGYLVKGAGPDRVEHALRAAAAGDVVLDHELARGVSALVTARRDGRTRPFPELTDREFAVLELVAQGLDNQAIAKRLFVSGKTVRNYVSTVFTKLHVADRAGAIIAAHRRGVGPADPTA